MDHVQGNPSRSPNTRAYTGPRPPVDADFTERDLRVPGMLEATEAAERAALSGELGSEAFLARMQAAEEDYERGHAGGSMFRLHSPVGTKQPSTADSQQLASPRSTRAVADTTRERVRAQLAAVLAVNPRLPGCLGDPAVAAAAAAHAEARLFEVSHNAKTVYQVGHLLDAGGSGSLLCAALLCEACSHRALFLLTHASVLHSIARVLLQMQFALRATQSLWRNWSALLLESHGHWLRVATAGRTWLCMWRAYRAWASRLRANN